MLPFSAGKTGAPFETRATEKGILDCRLLIADWNCPAVRADQKVINVGSSSNRQSSIGNRQCPQS
jgi:hypothetical protein